MAGVIAAFVVPGPVRGKGRPRFARAGKFTRTFTDDKTVAYEALVKLAAGAVMGAAPPTETAVVVSIAAYRAVPTSWSRRRREQALQGLIRPAGKPDCDNIAKIVCDAMNGIVYRDDAQVWDLRVRKAWDANGAERVAVTVSEE